MFDDYVERFLSYRFSMIQAHGQIMIMIDKVIMSLDQGFSVVHEAFYRFLILDYVFVSVICIYIYGKLFRK